MGKPSKRRTGSKRTSPNIITPSQDDQSIARKKRRQDGDSDDDTITVATTDNDSSMASENTADRQNFYGNQPCYAGNLSSLKGKDKDIPVHTLILGNHPSKISCHEHQCYASINNAFWWIAGDCLGFRRDEGYMKGSRKRLKLTKDLWYDDTHVIGYDEQLEVLCANGFGLWNLVQSQRQEGARELASTGKIPKGATPNKIREFCLAHPSVCQIVLSNGLSGVQEFVKLFRPWLYSGELAVSGDDYSQECFRKALSKSKLREPVDVNLEESRRTIVVVVGIATSGACATKSYAEKRDFWHKHVYTPGMEYRNSLRAHASRPEAADVVPDAPPSPSPSPPS